MKKKVLLVDESLTVQKVVALTLDRGRYHVIYAKTRAEAMKSVRETDFDLILVSDQVSEVQATSFPKEVEVWLGRTHGIPPMVLITAEDIKEARHYVAVLKKPFSPQVLQTMVGRFAQANEPAGLETPTRAAAEEYEEQRLHKTFNETFNDEASLVEQTFNSIEAQADVVVFNAAPQEVPSARVSAVTPAPPKSDLWSVTAADEVKPSYKESQVNDMLLDAENSLAYKSSLEKKVSDRLETADLDKMVDKALQRLLPPIVERLVQERLDRLLKEQENFAD